VGAPRQILGQALVTLGAILGLPGVTQAQVGIPSGLTQVALVAHVAPRGSIQGVSADRETSRMGILREASVTVSMSANTGYRLIVRSAGTSTSRIWVRSVTGEFQELTAGSSVTVARDTHTAGQWAREVQYRIESAGNTDGLPVRYEIAISPQL
jgi:hypothetical protein